MGNELGNPTARASDYARSTPGRARGGASGGRLTYEPLVPLQEGRRHELVVEAIDIAECRRGDTCGSLVLTDKGVRPGAHLRD